MIAGLYIKTDDGEVKRIELYDDEVITINSSIQNVSDISKTFTDYSQTFTIPASDNNNAILKHWYDNAVVNGFDQRKRYDGFIEVDTQIFRRGKWQIESAEIKNNRPENYKLTFLGTLASLKDKFGSETLQDLEELNEYTIAYNYNNVRTAIIDPSPIIDIQFPLISSNRIWQYGSGAQNINNAAHAINYQELFPAVRIERIFDAIESRYGVNFSGQFLSQSRWRQAYLWLKNNEETDFVFKTKPLQLTFANYSGSDFINTNNNEVIVSNYFNNSFDDDAKFELQITTATNATVFLNVYLNGNLFTTISQTNAPINFTINSSMPLGSYTFEVQANTSLSYNYDYKASYLQSNLGAFAVTEVVIFQNSNFQSLNSDIDLTSFAHNITVSDFVSGILKLFNFAAFSDDGINYTLEQIERWYFVGKIKDYTKYCTTDLEVSKVPMYKDFNFEFQKSESIFNRAFADNFNREFGDLKYTLANEGQNFEIKLPFENLLFAKLVSGGNSISVGLAIKPEMTPYAPKPVILYRYENAATSFYLDNGGAAQLQTAYNVFGQDVKFQSANHSLNWGIENSSYLGQPVNNGLFNDYYLPYLNNLYQLGSRMVKVKMRLPYSEITSLKLNDRIVIRDKRYVINQYTTNLQTFETDFELLQDFRAINFRNTKTITTDKRAKNIDVYWTSPEQKTWTILSDVRDIIDKLENEDDYFTLDISENNDKTDKVAFLKSDDDIITIIQQG